MPARHLDEAKALNKKTSTTERVDREEFATLREDNSRLKRQLANLEAELQVDVCQDLSSPHHLMLRPNQQQVQRDHELEDTARARSSVVRGHKRGGDMCHNYLTLIFVLLF